MLAKAKMFVHDVQARFIEEALYYIGIVIVAVPVLYLLGSKIVEALNNAANSL